MPGIGASACKAYSILMCSPFLQIEKEKIIPCASTESLLWFVIAFPVTFTLPPRCCGTHISNLRWRIELATWEPNFCWDWTQVVGKASDCSTAAYHAVPYKPIYVTLCFYAKFSLTSHPRLQLWKHTLKWKYPNYGSSIRCSWGIP